MLGEKERDICVYVGGQKENNETHREEEKVE